ncbi:hypothetical protein CVS40_11846 [Lucilia cuprina]|nr:hypothetical protein CVS40_11846 [Lucilia cuprina]
MNVEKLFEIVFIVFDKSRNRCPKSWAIYPLIEWLCARLWTRQPDQLCRSEPRAQRVAEGLQRPAARSVIVRSVNRSGVQLYTSTSSSLRRAVGSCSQAAKFLLLRAVGNASLTSEEMLTMVAVVVAEQSTNRTTIARPQQRGSSHPSPPANRGWSAFAAAGIRRRRERQHAEVLEAMAFALRTQGDVLASLVERVRARTAGEEQVARTSSQHTYHIHIHLPKLATYRCEN